MTARDGVHDLLESTRCDMIRELAKGYSLQICFCRGYAPGEFMRMFFFRTKASIPA